MTELAGSDLATQGPLYRDNNFRKKFIIADLVISGAQRNNNTTINTLPTQPTEGFGKLRKLRNFV